MRWLRSMASLGLLLVCVVALGACGGGGAASESQSEDSTAPQPGSATISALDVPASVACEGKTSTTVTVTYATEGAAKVTLLVDGRRLPEAKAVRATLDVPVHCDPLPHTFVLVAEDADGGQTADERVLTTEL